MPTEKPESADPASTFAEATDRVTAGELRARGSLKWTKPPPEVIGAWIAEMDFGSAPAVTAALRESASRADFGYLTPTAAGRLAEACARWQEVHYGWHVHPERIKPLPDVLKALEASIQVFSRPGSPVILPTPAYMPFVTVPPRLGREVIQVPMVREGPAGRYALDIDGIDAAFKAGGHLLVLINPSNPVGRVYTRSELTAVAEVVDRNGGRVFADEIHAPLVYPGAAHVPYASVSDAAAAHAITGTAASKGWNLPGLKCAQLILSSAADAAVWEEAGFLYEHGASTVGVAASIAAYADGGGWLADVVDYLDGSRRLLAELLAERLPSVGYAPPEGTYLSWLDCRSLGLDVSPAEFFLDKAGVLLTDGAACGDAGRGFVRLNFATPRPILAEMVERMAVAAIR
ncbi:MAG: aminotransferase class I/II-fold pyridoxal phosphate-dependent enzyme [Nocardiopsaceae bacterium]|nr:aminotransferase class I/II-fold pyridoxal phosphate-dependent enzyme [Nocardiopsaceae bacterium]